MQPTTTTTNPLELYFKKAGTAGLRKRQDDLGQWAGRHLGFMSFLVLPIKLLMSLLVIPVDIKNIGFTAWSSIAIPKIEPNVDAAPFEVKSTFDRYDLEGGIVGSILSGLGNLSFLGLASSILRSHKLGNLSSFFIDKVTKGGRALMSRSGADFKEIAKNDYTQNVSLMERLHNLLYRYGLLKFLMPSGQDIESHVMHNDPLYKLCQYLGQQASQTLEGPVEFLAVFRGQIRRLEQRLADPKDLLNDMPDFKRPGEDISSTRQRLRWDLIRLKTYYRELTASSAMGGTPKAEDSLQKLGLDPNTTNTQEVLQALSPYISARQMHITQQQRASSLGSAITTVVTVVALGVGVGFLPSLGVIMLAPAVASILVASGGMKAIAYLDRRVLPGSAMEQVRNSRFLAGALGGNLLPGQ